MNASEVYLAVDLGASGGRIFAAESKGTSFALEEVHRFSNGPVHVAKRLHWDLLHQWEQILEGLKKATARYGNTIKSIGVDTWGVDYVLLDKNEDLVGPAFCYRDARTSGIFDAAFQRMSREAIFDESGLQFMEFNTAYQLLSMRLEDSPLLDVAQYFLMIPDFFHWMLSGERSNEATNASTTQLLRPLDGKWSDAIMSAFDIPKRLFHDPIQPGTKLGTLRSSLANEISGHSFQVIAPATHDTGSAVLSVPASSFGESRPTWCYISSGTWSLMGVELDKPILTEHCRRLNFTNEGGALGTVRLLKNISGLWPFQQCREAWARKGRMFEWNELVAMADRSKPWVSLFDPDDARFVAPLNMVETIQDYFRDTSQSILEEPGAIARAALESLALRYRVCLGWLEELLGYSIETIHIVGGGSQNRLLCQMTADACQRQVIAGPVEATAIGNILMQQVGFGRISSIAQARQMLRAETALNIYEPNVTNCWDHAFERFQSLMKR